MLTAHQLTKSYGLHTVLQDITFSISNGERLGLIGPNGCGKTTLLRILAGLDRPDSGIVAHTRPGLRFGYLPQGFDLDPSLTLRRACELNSSMFPSAVTPPVGGTEPVEVPQPDASPETRLIKLAAALAKNPFDKSLQAEYDEILGKLERTNLQPASVLVPLGLAELPGDTPVGSLSGGQKSRLMLSQLLLEGSNLLLLDEPTNHLDIQMLAWLEGWLRRFAGAALIVSHDRTFLDHTVTRILDLDGETHTIREYAGNYSAYLEQSLVERKKLWDKYHDQTAEIHRTRQDINRTKQQALHVELTTTSREPGVRRYAKKVAKKALSREKKLERFLKSEEIIEKPRSAWQLKLDFATPNHKSREILVTEDLSIGYPGCQPLLSGLCLHIRSGGRIALTGPNGCGKTTLLRTISGQLEPLSGSVRLGPSFKLGYMTQEQELLDHSKSPLEIIQSAGLLNQTEARHFLHYFLFSGDDPLRPCGEMSYGERSRLELALLVAQGCTFLLLDEPINHLDIPSRLRFEQALSKYTGTVLAVVHDRYFIERFATEVWAVEDGKVVITWKSQGT